MWSTSTGGTELWSWMNYRIAWGLSHRANNHANGQGTADMKWIMVRENDTLELVGAVWQNAIVCGELVTQNN